MLNLQIDPRTDEFEVLIDEIKQDISERTQRGMELAAEIMPDMIRNNIDDWELLGWEPTDRLWLTRRVTYPGPERGVWMGTPVERAYEMNHTPLRDTDALYDSFHFEQEQVNEPHTWQFIATADQDQVVKGHAHDTGQVVGSNPLAIFERRHMFIPVPDGTDLINVFFQDAFG